eukprot:TRINITY_DN2776_c0_g1_i3.p1 TRINITY_DN2776_c0_g1~~TRINITY_DN2776_c0_g1_i3.p1  ORF type:complete len:254 (+),score=80.11 TRINITY_DN2776_c0_g1_i3:68-829(+)
MMAKRLTNKVAVVTGSTDGIGFAIAERFASEGAKVVVSSRKAANVKKAVETIKAKFPNTSVHGVVCHIGIAADRKKLVQETVEKFGQIDILVSNVAVNPTMGSTLETDEKTWDKIFDINVKCSFLIAQECVPHMKNGGSITFVASQAGFTPFALLGAYSVSKTALFGLTKVLAQELAPNIRVNCLAPGIIKTRFSVPLWKEDAIAEKALEGIPMRRFGTPAECAGTVAFLASEDASYVTGEIIVVNGGTTSRL